MTKRADVCYPPDLNPRSTSATDVMPHVPTSSELDAFCDSRSPTVVATLNILTGGCPPHCECPVTFCGGTVAHCHAVRNDDGSVFGYAVHPACDRQCAPIEIQFDADMHPTNIGTGTNPANYVQWDYSCLGQDTPVVCLARSE
jgi:hypothetical protein